MIRPNEIGRSRVSLGAARVTLHNWPATFPIDSATRYLVTEPIHLWRRNTIHRLDQLVRLPTGWDGYGSGPVSFENATFALRMLEAVCGIDAPLPQIVPGSRGDLQIEWHTESDDIELHVLAPNNVHCWRSSPDTPPDGEEITLKNDFTVIAGWVRELAERLSASSSAAA